jgi:hypothetical protein
MHGAFWWVVRSMTHAWDRTLLVQDRRSHEYERFARTYARQSSRHPEDLACRASSSNSEHR